MTDSDDAPVTIEDRDGKKLSHWGYYWLAYDQMNLLSSCQACNQAFKDGIGKRTRFPIRGKRSVYHDDDLSDEDPELINPFLDNPEEHLRVDPATGTIYAKTKKGEACIAIYALNKRNQLKTSRLRAAREITLLFQDHTRSRNDAQARTYIAQLVRGAASFTLASRSALREHLERANELEVD